MVSFRGRGYNRVWLERNRGGRARAGRRRRTGELGGGRVPLGAQQEGRIRRRRMCELGVDKRALQGGGAIQAGAVAVGGEDWMVGEAREVRVARAHGWLVGWGRRRCGAAARCYAGRLVPSPQLLRPAMLRSSRMLRSPSRLGFCKISERRREGDRPRHPRNSMRSCSTEGCAAGRGGGGRAGACGVGACGRAWEETRGCGATWPPP